MTYQRRLLPYTSWGSGSFSTRRCFAETTSYQGAAGGVLDGGVRRIHVVDLYAYVKEAPFFLACCSPVVESFSRAFGWGTSKGSVGTLRRMFASRPRFVARALSTQKR